MKISEFNVYRALYAATLVFVLSLWQHMVLRGSTLHAVGAFALLAILSFAYGRVFIHATGLDRDDHSGLTLEFVCGYLLLNTILFVLIVASPLGMMPDLALVGIGGLAASFVRRRTGSDGSSAGSPSLLALLLCATAATLWCADGLTPPIRDPSATTFRLWSDLFVHARLISTFVHGHGLASMSDLRMWGAPAYLYHYASYAIPAALSAVTHDGTVEIFSTFFLPFGVLLSGLAAGAFAGSVWGRWPGVAAAAAVLLVPDAYQQGFGNKYLSYNFMQQVNTAGLYGVACMAVAWMFVLNGCRSRRIAWIIAGWLIAIVALQYKAHLFVANAFLIMVYPCLFLPRIRMRWRIAVGAILIACFVVIVALSQGIDRVPILRLDGSGARIYVANLLSNQDEGFMKAWIEHGLGSEPWSRTSLIFYGSALVLLGTFGGWIVVTFATIFLVRRKLPPAIWAFPLFVIANYLVMALGLAMDSREIGSPDELLNRPLVWAYFAIAAWTGGAGYWLLFGAGSPRSTAARALLALIALLGLAVPLSYARNLQTFPHWARAANFEQAAVPTCLIEAARFIRDHSGPDDVVQDSENDRRAWVTAFTERPDFALDARVHPPPELRERLADLAALKSASQAAEIKAFAVRDRIDWYLLQPASEVAWPQSVRDEAVFECGGYRVFHFVR